MVLLQPGVDRLVGVLQCRQHRRQRVVQIQCQREYPRAGPVHWLLMRSTWPSLLWSPFRWFHSRNWATPLTSRLSIVARVSPWTPLMLVLARLPLALTFPKLVTPFWRPCVGTAFAC